MTRRLGANTPAFEEALNDAWLGEGPAPFCNDQPEEWSDYAEVPLVDEAEWMCRPCPLLDLCRENAERIRPDHGVWGGEAWKNGKKHPLTKRRPLSLHLAS
jgi:hypothetical protein